MDLQKQVHNPYESFSFLLLLTTIGGFLNAYTYVMHGEYLASMNTGNMIRIGVSLVNAHFPQAISYLVPILSNCFGATLAYLMREKLYQGVSSLWQKQFLLIEFSSLCLLLLLPHSLPPLLFHVAVSLLCGMQLATFPIWDGVPFATTLASGNLRFLGEHLGKIILSPTQSNLKHGIQYFALTLSFPLGAWGGIYLFRSASQLALVLPCLFLLLFNQRIKSQSSSLALNRAEQ